MHNQTFTDDSEGSSTTGLQRTQKGPCLAPGCSSHQVPRHWCLHIEHPLAQHPPTSTHLKQSTSPQEVWDLRVSIASWSHHREVQSHSPEHFHSLFLAGGMNFAPHLECWVPDNFQVTPENSSLPSSLDFILTPNPLSPPPKKKKNLHSLSLTLLSFPWPLTFYG